MLMEKVRRFSLAAGLWLLALAILEVQVALPGRAEEAPANAAARAGSEELLVEAEEISTWKEDSFRVFFCGPSVVVTQGNRRARSENAVIWFDESKARESSLVSVEAYMEGEASLIEAGSEVKGPRLFLRFEGAKHLRV